MALTKEQMLQQFASRTYEEVDGVRLQSLTELEMSDLRARWGLRYEAQQGKKGSDKIPDLLMRRELIIASIVDANGDRAFADEDAEILGGWHGAITQKLYEACRRLNSMDVGLELIEELEKKSESTGDSE